MGLNCEPRCIWELIIGLDSATLLKTGFDRGFDVDIGIKKASRSFRGLCMMYLVSAVGGTFERRKEKERNQFYGTCV